MAGSVVSPTAQTTGSPEAWMEPRSRDKAKTVKFGLMERKFGSVWLSSTPLSTNSGRDNDPSPILNVTLFA